MKKKRQRGAWETLDSLAAGDSPEGVARVMEYFTNALVPRALASGEVISSGAAPLPPEPEDGAPGPEADGPHAD